MSPARFAAQLMIAQGLLFAVETAAIHQIGSGAAVVQLACVRGVGGLALAILLARGIGFAVMRTRQLRLQLLRGSVSLLYLWVMIYSFRHLSFADATAISYTQSAYIALFSVLVLGETVTRSRWAAAAISIAGALLIAKPVFADWNIAYVIAILGAALNGLAFVLNRYLQREDSEATTLFYANLIAVIGSTPAFLFTGMPDSGAYPWLPVIIFAGPIGMYLGIVAVRHADASVLGPYTLLRLVISLVASIVVFRELPDSFSVVGAILILGSCLLSSLAKPRRLLGLGGRIPSLATAALHRAYRATVVP